MMDHHRYVHTCLDKTVHQTWLMLFFVLLLCNIIFSLLISVFVSSKLLMYNSYSSVWLFNKIELSYGKRNCVYIFLKLDACWLNPMLCLKIISFPLGNWANHKQKGKLYFFPRCFVKLHYFISNIWKNTYSSLTFVFLALIGHSVGMK